MSLNTDRNVGFYIKLPSNKNLATVFFMLDNAAICCKMISAQKHQKTVRIAIFSCRFNIF